MFKFGFSQSEDSEKGEEVDEVSWLDCSQVHCTNSKTAQCNSKVSIFTSQCVELKYITSQFALDRIQSDLKLAIDKENSDLVSGVYEGGLKVWECTQDLADFIISLGLDWGKKGILDLGCGAGILGMIGLLQDTNVTFHDYNREVLDMLTGPNVFLNFPDLDESRVQFFSGDWRSFTKHFQENYPSKKFDIILTSETIYNPKCYKKLLEVISQLLAPDGVCYLAAKSVYFGVGGSVYGFLQNLNNETKLKAETCWSTREGIARDILKITHDDS